MGCATSNDADTVASSRADTAASTVTPPASRQLAHRDDRETHQVPPSAVSPRRAGAGSPLRRDNPLESDPLLSPSLYSVVPRHAPAAAAAAAGRRGPSRPPAANPDGSSRRSSPPRHSPRARSPASGVHAGSPVTPGHGGVVITSPGTSLALSAPSPPLNRPPRPPGGQRPSGIFGSFESRADALTPKKRHSGSLTLFGPASQLSTTYGSLNSSRSVRFTDASASTGPSERSLNTTETDADVRADAVAGRIPARAV